MNGQAKKRRHEPNTRPIKGRVIPVRFQRPGLRAWARRLGDRAAACALIAFTLPLMAIVAIAIKFESPGPVFERQRCVGIGGRRFEMLSFRTSVDDFEDSAGWARGGIFPSGSVAPLQSYRCPPATRQCAAR